MLFIDPDYIIIIIKYIIWPGSELDIGEWANGIGKRFFHFCWNWQKDRL